MGNFSFTPKQSQILKELSRFDLLKFFKDNAEKFRQIKQNMKKDANAKHK
ncbi:MAG: hypothetical protein LUC34_02175 [Campylobacter sp.]|nr:hypothetical protein [Campylobacter sp.]